MITNPAEILLQGAELLKPLFSDYGFVFALLDKGESSGGPFASAEFRRANRRLEFHFRFSLGMVVYYLGSNAISHEEYMLSVLGAPHVSHYPGFSNNPLDAFRHLRDDVQIYCTEFLDGPDDVFLRRIEDAHERWAKRPKLPD